MKALGLCLAVALLVWVLASVPFGFAVDTLLTALLIGVTAFYAYETTNLSRTAAGQARALVVVRPNTVDSAPKVDVISCGGLPALNVDVRVVFFSPDGSHDDFANELLSPTISALLPGEAKEFRSHMPKDLTVALMDSDSPSGQYVAKVEVKYGDPLEASRPTVQETLDFGMYLFARKASRMYSK
jgi:hypothetical protein